MPHPAAPRAAAMFRGRAMARPYGPGETLRPAATLALPPPCRGAHCAPGRPFRHAASFKRQPAVRQSLRHGLRPCHLPLTREAKPPQTPRRRKHPRADMESAPANHGQSPSTPAARPAAVAFFCVLGYNNRETVIIQILRSGSPLWLTPARQPPFDAQLYHSAARHGIIAAVNGCGVLKVSASARRGTKPRPAR